jgi:hypothetical protein
MIVNAFHVGVITGTYDKKAVDYGIDVLKTCGIFSCFP